MPEILVEVVPDFSKLKTGIEQLADDGTISKEMAALFTDANKSFDSFAQKLGKLGDPVQKALKPAIDAAKKSINTLATSGIKDFGELKKRVDGVINSFTTGFGEGVEQALNDAGISLEEFKNALLQTESQGASLKQELRQMTEQLAAMKLRGEENSQQYQELSIRAGQYRDAIQDVTAEINRTASDTRKLDTAIEFATGLSAAFAAIQGAAALAGDQNEEFQKTLLKVNAAMSILAGLQQIQNLLQKESNLIRAITNTQLKGQVVLTNLQTAAQSKNIVVSAAATVGMRVLNAVMAANPALILVSAFGLLAGALVFFSNKAGAAAKRVDDLNRALDETGRATDAALTKIKNEAEVVDATLETAGAKQSERTKKRLEFLQKENTQLLVSFRKLEQEFDATQARINAGQLKNTEELAESQNKVLEKMTDFQNQFLENNQKIKVERIKLTKTISEENQKDVDDAIAKEKERNEKLAEIRQAGFQDAIAAQKLKLLQVEKDTAEELVLRKGLLRAELQLALDNDKLTSNQRKLLVREYFTQLKELDAQFQADRKKKAVEDAINIINAELNAINLSFKEREALTVELLEKQRQLELSAVINNKTKEKEINARFDKEIMEQRKQIREAAFAEEIANIERGAFRAQAAAKAIAGDDNKSFAARKKALDEIYNHELGLITQKRLNNQEELNDRVITLEEFIKRSKDLTNEEFTIRAEAEKAYTALVSNEEDKRKAKRDETVDAIMENVSLVLEAFKTFTGTMNAIEDQRIEAQRNSLQRLRDLNAITEKEFVAKSKVIDRLERESKQKQAEREKGIALFEAAVNGAAAIVKAAPNPFLIAATSVLVAAQLAAIIARPIPKFGKGTKKAPKGFAEVGETGTELIQTPKGYYIAEHPQIIWFKGGERVYNPAETREIIETPKANTTIINNNQSSVEGKGINVDEMAKKIGDEIARHPRNVISIDEDGFLAYTRQQNNVKKYLNKRFTFHD